LAESTGATGGEFPIFKSEGGAFDRAKFESMIINNAVGEIDPESFESMRAADSISKAAKIFYDESFDRNIREISPELDPKSIYYKEAYSSSGKDKKRIKERIEDGDTIDGKEIFEMSRNSAINKIANVEILKTGKPTEIIENLGYKDIKKFESFDVVRDEFNTKVKDENLKFDVLVNKFLDVLGYFNNERPMDEKSSALLYSPENNAIISALSKVLESEGFNNEDIVNMSKSYEDNLNKLIENRNNEKIEATLQETNENTQTENNILLNKPQAINETERLEEIQTEKPIEPALGENTGAVNIQDAGPIPTNTTSTENRLEEITVSPIITPPSSPPNTKNNSPEIAVSNTSGINITENNKSSVERAQDELFGMLGLKLPASTEIPNTETRSDNTQNTDKTSVESAQDKLLESLGLIKPTSSDKSPQNNTSPSNTLSSKETIETKISEKKEIIENKIKANETFSNNAPIKETEVQNLSSVSTPEPILNTNTQTENTQNTNTPTNPNQITNTESGENKVESINNAPVKENNQVDNKVSEENEKMNKEMANNIKAMVNLLGQLNNTLQSPLIVIPNDKKFG
jgi:hypothetical protein